MYILSDIPLDEVLPSTAKKQFGRTVRFEDAAIGAQEAHRHRRSVEGAMETQFGILQRPTRHHDRRHVPDYGHHLEDASVFEDRNLSCLGVHLVLGHVGCFLRGEDLARREDLLVLGARTCFEERKLFEEILPGRDGRDAKTAEPLMKRPVDESDAQIRIDHVERIDERIEHQGVRRLPSPQRLLRRPQLGDVRGDVDDVREVTALVADRRATHQKPPAEAVDLHLRRSHHAVTPHRVERALRRRSPVPMMKLGTTAIDDLVAGQSEKLQRRPIGGQNPSIRRKNEDRMTDSVEDARAWMSRRFGVSRVDRTPQASPPFLKQTERHRTVARGRAPSYDKTDS